MMTYISQLAFILFTTSIQPQARASEALTLELPNNLLTISSPRLPGGRIEIWYLEAFRRKGSTQRDWGKTTLPHHTSLLSSDPRHLRFRTFVDPDVEVLHEVSSSADEVQFDFAFTNHGS